MKPMPRLILAGALVTIVALVAACSGSTGGLGSVPSVAPTPSGEPTGPDLTPGPSDGVTPSTEPSGEPTDTPDASGTPAPTATPVPAGATMIVRNYFVLGLEPGSVGLVPFLREVPKTTAVATTAMKSLLAGPPPIKGESAGPSTAIPEGVRLLGLAVKSGIATVNLSTEFDADGGKESMQERLAQVVYTLTQFGTIRSVVFQVEGETVTVFGGEGLVLDGPQTRADYVGQLPAIFVDRPAYGAAFASWRAYRRQRGRLRGDLPGGGHRRRRQDARRPAGHGNVRVRLPRDLRRDGPVQGHEGAVGDAPGIQPVGQGRQPRGRPRVPGLADAGRLIRGTPNRNGPRISEGRFCVAEAISRR